MKTQNFYKKFVDFSHKTGIPVRGIIDLFLALGKTGELENSEVSIHSGLSKTSIALIEKEFYSLFKPKSSKTALSENGQRIYLYLVDLVSQNELSDITKVITHDRTELKTSIHAQYAVDRPETDRNLDQFLATTGTVQKRAHLMDYLGDIRDQKILFLGDDDFTSIEVATLGPAQKITVIDIDQRILNTISKISDTEKLGIETKKYDAKQSIGKDLWNQYDIVFTDPPYTEVGFELFLSRAIDVLDQNNKSARIYICFGHSDLSKERFIPITQILANAGLNIRYILNKFNRYSGAESIGSNSDLYICEVTPKTTPTLKGKYKDKIYTNTLYVTGEF